MLGVCVFINNYIIHKSSWDVFIFMYIWTVHLTLLNSSGQMLWYLVYQEVWVQVPTGIMLMGVYHVIELQYVYIKYYDILCLCTGSIDF